MGRQRENRKKNVFLYTQYTDILAVCVWVYTAQCSLSLLVRYVYAYMQSQRDWWECVFIQNDT